MRIRITRHWRLFRSVLFTAPRNFKTTPMPREYCGFCETKGVRVIYGQLSAEDLCTSREDLFFGQLTWCLVGIESVGVGPWLQAEFRARLQSAILNLVPVDEPLGLLLLMMLGQLKMPPGECQYICFCEDGCMLTTGAINPKPGRDMMEWWC